MDYARSKQDLDSRYEILETLGTGAFSEVKKAVHRQTGKAFAVKIIDRSKCIGKENMIQSEIAILKKVRHDNVIQLFELFETEAKIFLIMEMVTGGELFDSIVARGHYTELDAARIIAKILLAVDYLHEMGIAHRDLKPENLLFYNTQPDSKIMISDFGLSKIFNDEEMMKTACGTPGYVAPEVLKRQGYGAEVDLWSLGVIAYILLCGYPPFYNEDNQELFQQIMRGEFEFDSPHWDDISLEAKDFISKLLVVDPKKRYDTKKALRHSFIVKYCPEFVAQPPSANVITEPAPAPRNLAHRVSENLRSRGMSVSRRKSVDVKRVTPYIPSHAPPIPRPRVVETETLKEEEPEVFATPLQDRKKEVDSGILANGSQSVKQSKDENLNKEKDDGGQNMFIRQLSTVNRLIDSNNMSMAFVLLQQIDCPHKLRKLYEEMIFNSPDNMAAANQANMDSAVPNPAKAAADDNALDYEKFLEELQKLVIKKRPSSVVMDEMEKQTSVVFDAHRVIMPGVPANSFETTIVNDDSNNSRNDLLGSMIRALMSKSSKNATSPSTTSGNSAVQAAVPLTRTVGAHEIRLLSFDLNIKPPGIKNNASDYKDARLQYFCNSILPNYDLISIQNCYAFGSRRREKLLRKANDLGFKSWICSPGKAIFSESQHIPTSNDDSTSIAIDGGLIILSKYPIVRSGRLTFDKSALADRLFAKGALYAGIMVPGAFGYQFMHIFNTNLQTAFDPDSLATYDPSEVGTVVRRSQIKALRQFMEHHLNKELTTYEANSQGVSLHDIVLLMGNFNINARKGVHDGAAHGEEYSIFKKMMENPDRDAHQQHDATRSREFRLIDLVYEATGVHPVTFGETDAEKRPVEQILTNRRFNSVNACTDLIFQVAVEPTADGYKTRCPAKFLDIKKHATAVEKFIIPDGARADLGSNGGLASPTSADGQLATEMSSMSMPTSLTSSPVRKLNNDVTSPPSTQKSGITKTLDALRSFNDSVNNKKKPASNGNLATESNLTSAEDICDSYLSIDSSADIAESGTTASKKDPSSKSGHIKDIIDAKVEAVAAFFSSPDGKTKRTKKIKFTQLSDHYGISTVIELVPSA
eukprot:Partr_v1_DN28218_c0_g1_i1_m76471 putative calcium calmodulin-dependent protein kinase